MKRIQVIDLVRTFSIFSVLAYHWALTRLVPVNLQGWPAWLWGRVAYNGSLGVCAFFVVSGFLITRLLAEQPEGLLRPNLFDFYKRRIGRIVPLLLLIVLLGWILIHTAANSPALEMCFKQKNAIFRPVLWLSLVTFTFNWYVTLFSGSPYIGMQWDLLWSISIEEQFYLFYPLLLRKCSNKKELVQLLVLLFLLGQVIRWINVWFYPEALSYNSFQSFDQIALGCLLYLAQDRFGGLLRKRRMASFFCCCLGLVLGSFIYFHVPIHPELWWAMCNKPLFALGVCLFLLGGLNLSLFEKGLFKSLAFPGKLSYGIYLLHVWVLYLLWDTLKQENVIGGLLELTAAVLILAWISYRYFEMPVNLWIRKR